MDVNFQEVTHQNTGRWSAEEQERFETALEAHGKNWKTVSELVGTRSMAQVRSHAQKYFKKREKQLAKTKTSLPPDCPGHLSPEALYQEWMFHCSRASEYFYALSQFKWLQSEQERAINSALKVFINQPL